MGWPNNMVSDSAIFCFRTPFFSVSNGNVDPCGHCAVADVNEVNFTKKFTVGTLFA